MLYFVFSFGLLNRIRFRNLFQKEAYRAIGILRILGTLLEMKNRDFPQYINAEKEILKYPDRLELQKK
ncbi:MAG: hypothetical protein ACSHW8_14975 [Winogradskyella wichelsiae]